MNKETITRDNEKVALLLEKMNRLMENMESLAENYKLVLGGERFLTDKELSGMLKVSRRSLQDYRNEGRIPYIQLGGKILYRESDIEQVLKNGYRKAYREEM
ncbi:MAG: helix-turn-helix domain-containing protein [Bacteroides sp.]|nr:helix-turn-helix domain-containing protein [Bacteroides sp.]